MGPTPLLRLFADGEVLDFVGWSPGPRKEPGTTSCPVRCMVAVLPRSVPRLVVARLAVVSAPRLFRPGRRAGAVRRLGLVAALTGAARREIPGEGIIEIRGKIKPAARGIVGRRSVTHTPLLDAVPSQQKRELCLRQRLATERSLSQRRHFGPDSVARSVLALDERRDEFRGRPPRAPVSCEQVTEVKEELDAGSELFAGLRRIHHPPCVLHPLPPRRPGGVSHDEERCQFVLGAIVDLSRDDVGLDLVLVRLLDFSDELLKTRQIVLRVACKTAGELGT